VKNANVSICSPVAGFTVENVDEGICSPFHFLSIELLT
jgi:hypothetical protein